MTSCEDLHAFRRNWLAQAEHSPSGLSFFFWDEPEYEAFAELVGLPDWDQQETRELEQRYELVPRRWIKLHRSGGFSRYHVIDPQMDYPIASLRLICRRYGQGNPHTLEAALRPALEQDEGHFAFIIKQSGLLRLSCRVPRQTLRPLLASLVETGQVLGALAARQLDYDSQMGEAKQVFVTFQPGTPEILAVDYEQAPGYRKCRFVDGQPQISSYQPLPDTLSPEQLESLCSLRPLREPVTYFDSLDLPVQQLGQLPEGARETHSDLARRAQLGAGMKVLDAGCGMGESARLLAQAVGGLELFGLTLSPVQAEAARERGLEARVGDFHWLPYPEASFDRVLLLESLAYADDPARVLNEAQRVLRPGGRIFIKEAFLKDTDLSPSQRLELAEYQQVANLRCRTRSQFGLGGLEAQELSDYTLEAYRKSLRDSHLLRRYRHLPLRFECLLSGPR